MTADILRHESEAANAFGMRRGRLLGLTDGERADGVQGRRVQALSFAMHITLITLIIVPALSNFVMRTSANKNVQRWVRFSVPAGIRELTEPNLRPGRTGDGGSGGDRDPRDAGVGRVPLFRHLVLAPPSAKPPLDARLTVTPNLLGAPELHPPSPEMANWGNPLSKLLNDSSGPGHGGGIGSNCCGGIGDGTGEGYGPGDGSGWGVGPIAGKGGYGSPVCVYCPQPSFSREAVDAKIQGSIFIEAVISREGRPLQIRVLHGLGYGLDENAREIVRTWRFKPAMGPDGRAADVRMVIELAFRLY
jgi:TonB family protein